VTSSDTVLWDRDDAVATITLNRPRARNALTAEMKDALLEAVGLAAAEAAIRAVVLTGTGEAFCAGQDLREHADVLASGGEPTATVRRHYNPIITTIMTMPKPVIAAVNGTAAGAGASLALACDFRIAARRASLLMAFARVGLGADSGASWTLQRLAGAARAAELLMLAEPVDAEQARGAGLFTAVVPDDEAGPRAAELARQLAAGPTAAYAGIKVQLLYSATHAFVNRQRPVFRGS